MVPLRLYLHNFLSYGDSCAPIELDGIVIHPNDLIAADDDGIVIVPKKVEEQVVQAAWAKATAESRVRTAIRDCMTATEAFQKFGVL